MPEKSTARELPDLKGKRLGVSKGVMSQFPLILNAYGLKKSDFKINVMSIGDILAGIKDGNLDYGIHVSSTPNNGILDLAMSNGINLLTMSDEICAKIMKKNPYFVRTVIPSDVYSTKNHAQTLATRNIYICAANADKQVVYDFVKTLIEHNDDIAIAHPQAGDFGGEV